MIGVRALSTLKTFEWRKQVVVVRVLLAGNTCVVGTLVRLPTLNTVDRPRRIPSQSFSGLE